MTMEHNNTHNMMSQQQQGHMTPSHMTPPNHMSMDQHMMPYQPFGVSEPVPIKRENNIIQDQNFRRPPSYEEHMVQCIKREIQEAEHCLVAPPNDDKMYQNDNWVPRHSDYLHGYDVEVPPTTQKRGG